MKAFLKTLAFGVGIVLACGGCGSGYSVVSLVSPTISGVSPQVVTAGTPSVTLTVKGANFDTQSAVTFNGTTVPTTLVSSDTLAAQVGGSALAQPTVAPLQVRNSTGVESNAVNVTVTSDGTGPPAMLTITTTTLPAAQVGAAYSATLAAGGGTPGYTWSMSAGSLPAGLNLSSAGVISGTPTTSGTSNFTVAVADSESPAQTKTASLSMTTTPTTTPAPLTINTTTLGAGQVGVAYSATLSASGGTPGYTWSISSGNLPAGVTLSNAGVISGTPTTSGTSNFTVAVADSSSPVQTQTVSLSLTIAPATTAPLTINTTTLGAGQVGVAYSMTLSASGGTPSYRWSISSGNLPAGLTLSNAGVVSGMPTTSGTSNFTVVVTDSGTPAQSQTLSTSITIAVTPTNPGPGTTWYIRVDGGTRYSTNNPTGQCDGQADAAYSGAGVDQHCAFNDVRWLWDDQHSYNQLQWVISGGDTVIIDNTNQWRIGYDTDGTGREKWCLGWSGGPYGCFNPTIPAGSATQPTRILGRNYASCNVGNKADKTEMTQIFGGHGVTTALNLRGAQYVDVECIEITRHSQCIVHGAPAYPSGCSTAAPLDDYDGDGILTDANTHDLLLQDMWIHGHTDRGIKGPIGGTVTANRVDIDTNGMAGWDFDDGNATPNVNGVLKMSYTTIEWSGCNQEYPAIDPIPVISCYSQSTGGYGDGIGTPAHDSMDVYIDHSIFRYNTQDGEDFGHIDTGSNTLRIMDSVSYANSGGQFKWGPNFTDVLFENNIAVANCLRMSQPIPGLPDTYNAHLSDFCRANDALSFNFINGGSALFANNTIITYAPTTFDVQCKDTNCVNTVFTLTDNIVMGYQNPTTWSMGGQQGGVGGYCGAGCNGSTAKIGTINRRNNLYFGIRNSCIANQLSDALGGSATGESCADPDFVNEPVFVDEQSLDPLNFALGSGSPAVYDGIQVPDATTDLDGQTWHIPPSVGALDSGSQATLPTIDSVIQ